MATFESTYLASQEISEDETRRIALFLPSFAGGGAERVMLTLAEAFSARGFPTDLVVSRARGPLSTQVPPQLRVFDLSAPRVLASLPALVKYLRSERPAGMLSTLGHANLVALWARPIARVPLRIIVRETSTMSVAFAHAQLRRSKVMPFLARMFYPRADAIIAASEGMAEDMSRFIRLPRERIQVIANPVLTSELFSRSMEEVTHPWFASKGPPVILGVGRLTQAKDFPSLIRAFGLLRKQRSARLLILGEGEERSRLEGLVKELNLEGVVDLPGFVSNPFSYMKRASLFVLSSAWEGLPNVLIQALALGTPVVATDCASGPREILQEGKLGELVPVGQPQALAEAMIRSLSGTHLAPDPGNLGCFERDTVVKQYLDQILGGTQAHG